MSVEFFDGQRREMIAAIRVIAGHLAAEVGKAALDDRVLNAMAKVPRHEFVPVEVQPYAYLNRPLPIGFDKTISQPLMVAVMTDLLEFEPDDLVLEIGTRGKALASHCVSPCAQTIGRGQLQNSCEVSSGTPEIVTAFLQESPLRQRGSKIRLQPDSFAKVRRGPSRADGDRCLSE